MARLALLRLDRRRLAGVDAGDPRRVDRPLAAEEDEAGNDADSEDNAEPDPDRAIEAPL